MTKETFSIERTVEMQLKAKTEGHAIANFKKKVKSHKKGWDVEQVEVRE